MSKVTVGLLVLLYAAIYVAFVFMTAHFLMEGFYIYASVSGLSLVVVIAALFLVSFKREFQA